MRGQLAALTALAAHKQPLVAECDLHRAELGHESRNVSAGAEGLIEEVRAVASMVSDGVAHVVGATQLARSILKAIGGKPSWGQILINGARAGCSFWLALRTRGR